jgi:2-haloacid dehalogenase
MRISDFDALSFDCYGTLIDWESGIVAELRPWLARNGLKLDDNAMLEAFADAESRRQAETPTMLYPQILANVYRDLGHRWDIPVADDDAAAFGASVGRWPAFPDSATALQYLKQHYKLVILSNVDRASFARSKEWLGVAFDKIITAEDIGSYKPNPRNFEVLIREVEALGVGRARLLHTAQSLFHDVAPARAAGLATVWINRRKGKAGRGAMAPPPPGTVPDLEVASLAELADLHRREVSGGRA